MLYGIDTAEKRQVLKKEAKWFTCEMVFGKKSWWKTWLEYPANADCHAANVSSPAR
jgi:hypothetical protein